MSHFNRITRPRSAQFEYDEATVRLQAMNALLTTLTGFYLNLVNAKGKGQGSTS